MKSILIFLHRKMDSLVLNKLITDKVPNVNLIVIPPVEIDHVIQYQAAQNMLYDCVMAQCASIFPQDMACVIFESNYGLGGSDIFCNVLYQKLRETFDNAIFITYSSTVGSLNLALQNSPTLLACYNVQICSDQIDYLSSFPENYHARIILKNKLLVNIKQLLEVNEEKENHEVPQCYEHMSIDRSEPPVLTQFSTITAATTSSSLDNRTNINASPIPTSRRSPNTSKL